MKELKLVKATVMVNFIISIMSVVLLVTLFGKACYLFMYHATGISNGCLYNSAQADYIGYEFFSMCIMWVSIVGIILGAMAFKKVKYMFAHPEYPQKRRTSRLCIFFSMPNIIVGPLLAILAAEMLSDIGIPSIDIIVSISILCFGLLIWVGNLVLWIISLVATKKII